MIKYKNYVIEPGLYGGFTLSETKFNKNKKEEYLSTISYPSTLKSCLEEIMKKEFADKINDGVYSLDQAIEILKEIYNEIKIFLSQMIKEEL